MSEREMTVQPDAGEQHRSQTEELTPDAFASQFQACSRKLWCIAAGVLGRPTQADDVVQEAAMIALKKLDQFDPQTNFTAWVGQIVRYVALNHGRRTRNRTPAPLDQEILDGLDWDEPQPAIPNSTEPIHSDGRLRTDQHSFDDDVEHALQRLDDTARACLLLRTIMQMPYKEIAQVLDIPAGTAMSHVFRAQKTMRGALATRFNGQVEPTVKDDSSEPDFSRSEGKEVS